jgi:aminopeptidase
VRELVGIDPARISRLARSRRAVRAATLRKRWCSTLWLTDALAARVGMAPSDVEAFVRRALFLDRPDPVSAWGRLRAFWTR